MYFEWHGNIGWMLDMNMCMTFPLYAENKLNLVKMKILPDLDA